MSDEKKPPLVEAPNDNATADAMQQDRITTQQQIDAGSVATSDVEPARQAEYLKLAKEFNTNPEFIKQNYDQFKPMQARKKIDSQKLTHQAPVTSKWIANPENMALAKNDTEKLSELERRARVFQPKAQKKENSYLRELYTAARTGGYGLHQYTLASGMALGFIDPAKGAKDMAILGQLQAEQHQKRPEYVQKLDEIFEKKGEDFMQATKEWQAGLERMERESILEKLKGLGEAAQAGGSQFLNFIDFMSEITISNPKAAGYISAESFVNSFPSLAAGLGLGAAGAATGPLAPVAAPTGFLVGTFGGSYMVEYGASMMEDLSKEGIDITDEQAIYRAFTNATTLKRIQERASRKGVGTAGVDALLGGLITGSFIKGAPSLMKPTAAAVGRRVGTTAAKTGAEMLAEGIAEGAGQALREGDIGKVDLREVGLEIAAAGPQSAVTAVGGEALMMAAEEQSRKNIEEIRAEFADEPVAAAKEVTEAMMVDQATLMKTQMAEEAVEQIEQMEGVSLSPEKLEEVTDQMTGGVDGEQVYFQTDDWDAWWTERGMSPVEMADKILGNTDAYVEAKNTGQAISMPASKFIAKAGVDAEVKEILEIMRTEPDGLTRQQSQERLQQLRPVMERLAEEALQLEEQQAEADQDRLTQVAQELEAQLREAQPNISARDAKRQSLVFQSSVRALADRMQMSPDQFMQRYPLTVKKGEVKTRVVGDQKVLYQGENINETKKALAEATVPEDVSDLGFYSKLARDVRTQNFNNMPAKNFAGSLGGWSVLAVNDDGSTGKKLKDFSALDEAQARAYARENGGTVKWASDKGYKQDEIEYTEILEWLRAIEASAKEEEYIVTVKDRQSDDVVGEQSFPTEQAAMNHAAFQEKSSEGKFSPTIQKKVKGNKVTKQQVLDFLDNYGLVIKQVVQGEVESDKETRVSLGDTARAEDIIWNEETLDADEVDPYGDLRDSNVRDDISSYWIDDVKDNEDSHYANEWKQSLEEAREKLGDEAHETDVIAQAEEIFEEKIYDDRYEAETEYINSGDSVFSEIKYTTDQWGDDDVYILYRPNQGVEADLYINGRHVDQDMDPLLLQARAITHLMDAGYIDTRPVGTQSRQDIINGFQETDEDQWTASFETEDGSGDGDVVITFDPGSERFRVDYESTIGDYMNSGDLTGADSIEQAKSMVADELEEEGFLKKPEEPDAGEPNLIAQLPVPNVNKPTNRGRWQQISLEGGEDYREFLIQLPPKKLISGRKTKEYTGGHFEKNTLVHVRVKTRMGKNGEKVLFIEEIQSDWHQQGRDQGYERERTPEEKAEAKEIKRRIGVLEFELKGAKRRAAESAQAEQKENWEAHKKLKQQDIEKEKADLKELEDKWEALEIRVNKEIKTYQAFNPKLDAQDDRVQAAQRVLDDAFDKAAGPFNIERGLVKNRLAAELRDGAEDIPGIKKFILERYEGDISEEVLDEILSDPKLIMAFETHKKLREQRVELKREYRELTQKASDTRSEQRQVNVIIGRRKQFIRGLEAERDISLHNYAKQFISESETKPIEQAIEKENNKLSKIEPEYALPDAPFKTSTQWMSLALKRMLSVAQQENFDMIAWTSGEMQVDRYNKARYLKRITYRRDGDLYIINGMTQDDRPLGDNQFLENELVGAVGKATAEQIIAGEGVEADGGIKVIEGDGLSIGDQGHKDLYDTILRNASKEVLKKINKKAKLTVKNASDVFGSPLQESGHSYKVGGNKTYEGFWAIDLDDTTKAKIAQGQTLFQDRGDGPKGRIRFGGPEGFQIEMLENADKSTFFHELGHYYLEVLGDLAEDSSAPQDIRDDYQVLLDWFGVQSRDQIEVSHHEQFARGFEAYLMEGKAPSLTLRKAFHRFKVWLIKIYKDIRALDVELTEDVRNVMGRVVATRTEIEEASAKYGLLHNLPTGINYKALTDPRTFGMTGKAAERFTEAIEEARRAAEEELQAELMAGYLRENEKWWKEETKRTREEVISEVGELPVYKAMSVLQRGKMPDGSPVPTEMEGLKLNRQDLVNIYGAEFVKNALPRPFVYSREGGVHPDVVAPLFGYDSGDEMIQDMVAAMPFKQFVDQETQRRMFEKYPDVAVDTAKMEEMALKAIHNEKQAKLYKMMLDWLWQNRQGQAKEALRRGIRGLPSTKEMREQAEQILGNKVIRDIRPHLFIAAQKRHNRAAAKKLTGGDFEGAYRELELSAINHELMRASYKVNDNIKKRRDRFKKLKQSDEKLAKSREVDFVNAARAIVAMYIGGQNQKPMEYLEQMRAYNPEGYLQAAFQIEQLSDIQPQGSFKDLTLDQFERIAEVVDALWDLSREAKLIEKDGKKMSLEEAEDEMISQIEQVDQKRERRKYDEDADQWDHTKSAILSVRAMYRRMEHWVSAMDQGDPDGPFRKFLWEPISEATDQYQMEYLKYKSRLKDMLEKIQPTLTPEPIESDELQFKFRDKAQLLGALMHIGNESNKRKMLLGRAWGVDKEDGTLDTSQWDAFMDRMFREGVITKEDMDFIQGVWDLYEEIKPAAQKAHKKVFGFYFNEITADEFETPFGMYRGGYAPAKIDPNPPKQGPARAYNIADKQKMEELAQGHSSFNWPAAGGTGQYKTRVAQFNMPLSFELSHISRHLDDSLRFIHIKPLVIDAAKLVNSQRVRGRLTEYDASVVNDLIFPYLSRADKNRVDTLEGKGANFIWKFASGVRNRIAMQIMFLNVKNILEQTSGFAPALARVKPKFLMDSLGSYIAAPKTTVETVAEKSDFMKVRYNQQVFDIDLQIKDILKPQSKLEKMRSYALKHTYVGQTVLQHTMDTAVWMAQYNEAIEAGHGEKKAIRMADSTIRETQVSIRAMDVSRMEANPYLRIFQMFMSFFNNMANLNMTEFDKIVKSDMSMKDKYARGIYVYAVSFASLAIASELVARALGPGLDDEDDGFYLDDAMEILFGSQVRLATGMIPVAGPALQAGINRANDVQWDDRVSASPAIEALSTTVGAAIVPPYRLATGEELRKKDVKDIFTALGVGLGLPLTPVSKPILYYMDVQSGRARPTGPVDYTRGLLTGHRGSK